MKFWKNVLSLIVGNGTTEVINFAFLMILVRFYNTLDYSIYRQGNLLITTIAPFLVWGITISLSYYIPRTSSLKKQNQYVVNCIIVVGTTGSIGCAALILFGENIARAYNNLALIPYMACFGGILLLETVYSFYPYYMVAVNNARRLALITGIFAVIRITTLLICVSVGAAIGVVIVLLLVNSLLKALFVFAYMSSVIRKTGVDLDKTTFIEQLKFSIPLGVSSIIFNFMNVLDKNLTSIFYEPKQFTTYVNGVYNLPFIGTFTGSISSALLPRLSTIFKKDDKAALDAAIKIWHQTIIVASTILIPFMFVMMTFAEEVTVILFTDQYIQSASIFRVSLLVLLTKVTYFGNLLTVAQRQKQIIYSSLIAVGALVLAYVFLHRTVGFELIVWAVVVANFVLVLMMLLAIKRTFHQSLRQVYPWNATLVMCVAGLVAMFIFQLLKGLVVLPPILTVLILGIPMYGLLIGTSILLVPEARILVRRLMNEYVFAKYKRTPVEV